ncbi:MAG TPA: choice-of-anchor P family protein [Nocardioidaceae bacterium]|nr:choice-of-anchor P family protein [Nocardioidaceae bacterium]
MRPRTTLLRRAAASITAAGVALSGAVALTAAPAQSAERFETPFAYQGSAYGTRVSLGDPNAGGVASGRTAWSVLGCTSMAPIFNNNGSNVAKLNANSMIEVGAVDSSTSSYRKPKKQVFGSRSVNKVAGLTIGPEDGPRLKFGAFTTTAHAFNDKGRFKAAASFDVLNVEHIGIAESAGPLGDLLDAIDAGDNQLIEEVIAGAGTNGIAIPGLGTIYPAGSAKTPRSRTGATANAYGIRVALENGSQVNIGRAWARIQSSYPAGVFAGHAYGLEAKLAEGVVGIGRTPYQNLPCIGTNGEWRQNSLAEVPQNENLNAGALRAETYGKPFRDGRAIARARSTVADVVLAGGQLEIQAVVGQVNVFQNRKGRVVRRTIDGTRVGAIIANGEPQEIPAPGESLKIDGVAFIKAGLRQNLGKRGLRVHALRVELLDGTGLVLNIGTAKAKILR